MVIKNNSKMDEELGSNGAAEDEYEKDNFERDD